MTKRKNMTAGQRQVALEKKVEQLEMATRISQMLLQQIGNSTSALAADIRELANRQRDIQYRLLALQDKMGLNVDEINKLAETRQIKDFDEASDKEDLEKGYSQADVVEEDSVVILTTKAENEARSILRSKLSVSDIQFPDFREALLGKKPNDVVETTLNGVKHEVTILDIRKKPEEKKEEASDAAGQQAAESEQPQPNG